MEWLTLVVVFVLALVALKVIGFVLGVLWTLVIGMVVGLVARGMLSADRKPAVLSAVQAGAAGSFVAELLAWTVWRGHGLLGTLLLQIVGAAGAVALLAGKNRPK